jgi:hypothetical protein
MWPFFAPNLTILTWPSLVSVTHAAAHRTQRRFHRLPKLVDSSIPRNHVVFPISIPYPWGSFHLGWERTAGGVAMYRNLQSVSTYRQLVTLNRRIRLTDNLVGDFWMVSVDYRPRNKIHTGSRLHPSQRDTRINRILHVSNAWRLLSSH